LTKTKFKQLQTHYGITYLPEGILWDMDLRRYIRPAEMITFDSMHCLVSNGIVQNETSWLLIALEGVGVTWSAVEKFCTNESWRFCSSLGSHSRMKACFTKARALNFKSSKEFKAGASEMLMIQPVLLHFCEKVVLPLGLLVPEIRSYSALGRVLNLICMGKAGQPLHQALKVALREHAKLCGAAYDVADFKPKNHYVHHIPLQLRRDGLIVDCFVGERKNAFMKAMAKNILRTDVFERSVLARAVCTQLEDMVQASIGRDLLLRPTENPGLASTCGAKEARTARSARVSGCTICAGDALLIEHRFCEVSAVCEVDGCLYFAARWGDLRARLGAATRWALRDTVEMIDVSACEFLMVPSWYFASDGAVIALCEVP